MSMSQYPPIKRIFHPTDLSAGSAVAFLHALRIALVTKATLTVFHVTGSDEVEWCDLPGVRSTLAKWGYVKDENDMEGLRELGLGVRKVIAEGRFPVRACMRYLKDHPTDLVVLATQQEKGRKGWFGNSDAEPIGRGSGEPTLFVPSDHTGFVDAATGKVNVHNILIPIAMDPHPEPALRGAMRVAEQLAGGEVVFTLLHVGQADTTPVLELPERMGWSWKHIVREGEVVDTIIEVAQMTKADLIVMTTKGHDGFLDALRGNTTERVLRSAPCPVVAGVS